MTETMEIIEKKTCGRCGGSGKYSYCQRYGHTCFGCGGSGKALTKRGHAVAEFCRQETTINAEAIEVGMRIRWDFSIGGDGQIITATVGDLTRDETMTNITTVGGKQMGFGRGCTVRLVPKGAALEALRAKAVAYRDSLTLSGKPRKLRGAG